MRPVYMQILLNMNDWIIETILNYDQDKMMINDWHSQDNKNNSIYHTHKHAHKHTLRTWHPTLYPCVTHFHLQLNQESVPLLSPHCRSAFPAVCQALCTASLKPDVRVAAIESLRLIQTMTRDSVWCWTENQLHQQELKRILI